MAKSISLPESVELPEPTAEPFLDSSDFASSGLLLYKVVAPIEHGGQRYEKGQTLTLAPEYAALHGENLSKNVGG